MKIGLGLKIFLGAMALGLSTIGFEAYRTKRAYSENGAAIESLFSKYEAIKFPLSSDELQPSVPLKDNSWPDFGRSIIKTKAGNELSRKFNTNDVRVIFPYATLQDLDVIKKVLAKTQVHGDLCRNAILAKPRMVVTRNYNEGAYLLLPELASFKALISWYISDARVALVEGDINRARTNLLVCEKLIHETAFMPTFIDKIVAISMAALYYQGLFLLAEDSPIIRNEIEIHLDKMKFMTTLDPKSGFKSEFLMSSSSIQYLDSPALDKRRYGWPLNNFLGKGTEEDYLKFASVKTDRWIPRSATGRRALRKVLEAWLPAANMMQGGNSPDIQKLNETASQANYALVAEPPFNLSLGQVVVDNYTELQTAFAKSKARHELAVTLAKGLRFQQRTGKWPHSWKELGVSEVKGSTASETFDFVPNVKGILIQSSLKFSGDNTSPSMSYPVSLGFSSSSLAQNQARIAKIRTEK